VNKVYVKGQSSDAEVFPYIWLSSKLTTCPVCPVNDS